MAVCHTSSKNNAFAFIFFFRCYNHFIIRFFTDTCHLLHYGLCSQLYCLIHQIHREFTATHTCNSRIIFHIRRRCDLSAEGCSLEEYGLLSCTLAIDSRSHPCSSATNDSNIINPHIFSFPNKLFLHFLIAVIHFSFTLNCNMFQSLLTYFWTYLHRLSLPRSLRF